jgi:hypothetical protein
MLRCEECSSELQPHEDARGWRAFLTGLPDDDVRGHTDDDELPGVA